MSSRSMADDARACSRRWILPGSWAIDSGIDPTQHALEPPRWPDSGSTRPSPQPRGLGRITAQKGIHHLLDAAPSCPVGPVLVVCQTIATRCRPGERLMSVLLLPHWIEEMLP